MGTNFKPEINIREVTAKGRYWEGGAQMDSGPVMEDLNKYGLPWKVIEGPVIDLG